MNKNENWTTVKIIKWTSDYLQQRGVANSRLEAEWMLCAATNLDRIGLYLNFDKPLDERELSIFRSMISRRAKREPLQQILGSEEFFGLDFEVNRDVLVPRHDTEIIVEQALARKPGAKKVLDIGTGSGCLAITLSIHLTYSDVTAVDISEAALLVASRNSNRHGAKVRFLCGSLFQPVKDEIFDLIVSNPPYIPSDDISLLEPEVSDFDPWIALDGGKDGLDFYRTIVPEASSHLSPGGWLLLEVGDGQSEKGGRDVCQQRFIQKHL